MMEIIAEIMKTQALENLEILSGTQLFSPIFTELLPAWDEREPNQAKKSDNFLDTLKNSSPKRQSTNRK